MTEKTDFYRRLNLNTGASEEAIKKAYRKAVKEAHPDVNRNEGATQLFLDIQEAYNTLSDPEIRKAYDEGREPGEISRSIHTALLYSKDFLLKLNEPQVIYTLIDIVSSQEDQKDRSNLPLNLSLVLDNSTSMAGARMDILKTATKEIIEGLEEEDLISVVSFNDRAKTLLTSQTQPSPAQIEISLGSLFAEGGTEIFQGLESGYQEIKKNAFFDYVNHIILITDGHTYGDEDKCINLAREAAKSDIGISGLGIGIEWNDEFVDKLCAITGGQCLFIDDIKKVKDFLQQSIASLKNAQSKRVSLEIQTAPNVKMLSAFRILPEALPLPGQQEYSLGVLKKDQPHRILFEFLVEPVDGKIDLAVIASGLYSIKRTPRDLTIPFTLQRPLANKDKKLDPPPDQIFQAISHLTFYRLQEKAQHDVATGNPGTAYRRLINLSSHLMAKGDQSLARIAMKEAEHIKENHNFSPTGKKQLKYGTIHLKLPEKT
jgi:Ca-activated chloride channel family protein